jgi:flagellar biosynthetic protein FliR
MGVGSIDVQIPETIEWLIVACGLELLFGLAIGMCASAVFIAAQWAGELIGQQVGFNISEAFDPQFSGGSTLVSEVYFLLTLCVFLIVGGHRTMVEGVHQSLLHLPPALLSVEPRLGDLVLSTADAAATVALRLAMPVFLSMLIVDFTIGAIGRSMPQLNVMTAGLSIRAALGLLIVGLSAFVTADVLEQAVLSGLATMSQAIGV